MYGIDVSNTNGHVAWGRVASSGIGFAFAKATEGLTYDDPFFKENRDGAHAYGIPFGAYHFGRPDHHPGVKGARAEADAFCRCVGTIRPGELRPVLDLEVGSGPLTAWAGAFLSEVEKKLGVRPILYSYSAFIYNHLSLKALPGYPLWLADYGPNDGEEHPAHIQNAIHQFTSRAVVSGVIGHVDKNSAVSLDAIRCAKTVVPNPDPQNPQPEPKNQDPFTRKLWPVPLPAWFWNWAQWHLDGQSYTRPADAPKVIPPWAWVRLKAL